MENQQMQQIRRWIDVSFRRKALISFLALIGLALGLAHYLTQPKIYRSTALLSYQQQRINPSQMSPDLVARIRENINTVTNLVLSRTSLEQIVVDQGLLDTSSDKPQSMEGAVERLRALIHIEPSRQGDTFIISFVGTDPEVVEKVTNSLAARFIDENLKYREERAAETSVYTSDELVMAKEILDRREATMRDYKLQYFNEMPEQREGNLTRLTALQQQYQSRQDSIQDLERTRVLIQEQINVRRQLLADTARSRLSQVPEAAATAQPETDRQRLARLQGTLQNLLGRYTEQHPEIRQLRREIGALQQVVGAEATAGGAAGSDSRQRSSEPFDQELFDLQIQMKDVVLNIKKLNEERAELKKAIDQYEAWIEAVPEREAEWSALTREYAELRRHYDHLVSQNLQAQSALNLERKQKGSQFRIEDPARVAEKPIRPVFLKVMAIALLAGLGFGVALAVGLELLDASFRSAEDFENNFPVEVLCSIPYLPLRKEIRRARFRQVAGIMVFVVGAGVLVAVTFYGWQHGTIIL
jgi:polysaccharide biosynthesis transport protein